MFAKYCKLRILLIVSLAAALAAAAAFVWLNHRPRVSEVFTTQNPGQARITWHTMEKMWELGVFQEGSALQIPDIKPKNTSLYTTTNEIVSKIDKSTGNVIWRKNINRPGEAFGSEWYWSTSPTPQYLIAAQLRNSSSSKPLYDSRLCCFRSADGKQVWEITLDTPIASEPVVSGSRVLVPLSSGEVACFSISSATQLWRKQISVTHFQPQKNSQEPQLMLSPERSYCIVRSGPRHFMAIDPSTGQTIWSRTISGKERYAERLDVDDVPFTLQGGILFFAASSTKITAWNAATAAPLWSHKYHLPKGENDAAASEAPIITRDLVLSEHSGTWTALRRKDGSCAWDGIKYVVPNRQYEPRGMYIEVSNPACDTFYMTTYSDPIVCRGQQKCRSTIVDVIVAIDLSSGKERWRWQNDVMDSLQSVVPVGDKLYCNAGDRVVEIEPGPGESLPPFKDGRTQLAYRMIQDLAQWNPTSESLFFRLVSRITAFAHPNPDRLIPSTTHARLCLLNLQSDSIAPLVELIAHRIEEIDSNKPSLRFSGYSPAWQLEEPLDMLYDIRAYSAIPALIKDLQTTRSSDARQRIAELLIRLNKRETMPALYTYINACTDSESVGGEETLSYLCGFAPSIPTKDRLAPTQDLITNYLVRSFSDDHSPVWLHRFAQFELARGRGAAARNIVVNGVRYEPRARLMPTISDIMRCGNAYLWSGNYGNLFAPLAKVRDRGGKWWGVFECGYFNQGDVWVAQSRDGKNWTSPTVGIPDLNVENDPKLAWKNHTGKGCKALKISWKDETTHRRSRLVCLSGLYKDSDGDGIPDIVERELGTDPNRRDSVYAGLSDSENKNPKYKRHRLSRQEQIYQAVIEGVCRYSNFVLPRGSINRYWAHTGPVDPDSPLFLPAGPANAAVPIYSHRHSVFMYSTVEVKKLHRHSWGDVSFSAPAIGFDHKLTPRSLLEPQYIDRTVENSYPESQPSHGNGRFKAWFPFLESADKTQVRVSVYGRGTRFDVEVDRIGGKWLPVECRQISQAMRSNSRWDSAAPVRDN